MAKLLSFLTTDTPISGVTTNAINLELVNFGADFVEKNNAKKGEVIITNVTAPISAPETFRFAMSTIDDVYRKSGVEPSMRSLSNRGASVLIESKFILKETDSTDVTYSAYVPVKIHTVLEFPTVESMTDVIIEKSFRRHAALFYGTGIHTSARLGQIYRGVLLPPDVK